MFLYYILPQPATISLIFALLLLLKKDKSGKSGDLFAAILILCSICYIIYVYYYTYDYKLYYKLDIIFGFLFPLVTSLGILYTNILTRNRISLKKGIILFAPPLILATTIAVIYYIMGEERSILFTKRFLYRDQNIVVPNETIFKIQYIIGIKIFNYFVATQVIWLVIEASILLKKYNETLRNYYSNTDDKNINENRYTILTFIILCIVLLINSSIENIRGYCGIGVLVTIAAIYSILLFSVGRWVLNIKYTAADFDAEIEKADRHEGTPANKQDSTKHIKIEAGLLQLINEDKVFLRKSLCLDDVATTLCTNRSYISEIINKKGTSFADFINLYRIEHAKKLITSNPNASMEDVAETSGFASYISFYRAFKQQTGETPKEWSKKQQPDIPTYDI